VPYRFELATRELPFSASHHFRNIVFELLFLTCCIVSHNGKVIAYRTGFESTDLRSIALSEISAVQAASP